MDTYFTPISNLNPFNTNVTLKVRLSTKSAIIPYQNQKGAGKRLTANFVDSTGEIGCTMFNDVVDQFDPILEVGKVYFISKASIKPGNPKFTKNDFEMSLFKTSSVVLCTDDEDEDAIPSVRYAFMESLAAVEEQDNGHLVDVLAVVHVVKPLDSVTTKKDSRQLAKLSIELIDRSKRPMELTLWGDKAENFEGQVGSVLAIKDARVSEFRNLKNLAFHLSTTMEVDPTYDVANELRDWYQDNQSDLAGTTTSQAPRGTSVSSFGTLAELNEMIAEQQLSGESKPVYRKIRGTVVRVMNEERNALVYKAAPGTQKKVVPNTLGGGGKAWFCPTTNQYFDEYEARYIFTILVADSSRTEFLSVFDAAGVTLLGQKAGVVEGHKESGNSAELNVIINSVVDQTFIFDVKAMEDTRGEDNRIRMTVSAVEPIDFVKEGNRLLQELGVC